MSEVVIYTISTNILMSLFSLIGVISLYWSKNKLNKIIYVLVSLSAGTLLGGAFMHLIPEGLELMEPETFLIYTLFSFIGFFILEKALRLHHCHDGECDVHTFGHMNLIGDSFHNFLDGIIIALAYATSIPLGISTSIAILFHEIPQEIGDFGVLIHSGFEPKRALYWNFIVALISVVGGAVGLMLISINLDLIPYLLPIASGSLLYVSTSDLIPELRKETNRNKDIITIILLLAGVGLMYLLTLWE